MGLLDKVVNKAPALPSRVYFYAPEKFGKSSWAAYAPKPIYIMTEGETGLLSLMEAGRIPDTPHFPDDCKSWLQLQDYCHAILREDHDYRTLVIDTANGAERLLSSHILHDQFNGQMTGKEGYGSYGKGDLACVPHWSDFLALLDQIRTRRKMLIVLLAHAKIKTVNNPTGPDYDQVRPEGIDKLWSLTHKWSDIIACGSYELFVKDDKVRESKGRVILTSSSPAAVAGNRYGLPDKIQCGNSAQQAWKNFQDAVVKAKSAGRAPAPQQQTTDTPAPQQQASEPASTQQPEPETEPEPEPDLEPLPRFRPTSEQVKELLATIHAADLVWPVARAQYGPAVGLEFDDATHVTAMSSDQVRAMIALLKPLKKRKAVTA
jgi:hypothetical protein